MTRTLSDWLDHQQRLHPSAIALGLERVRTVWRALGAPSVAPAVVTVGGTNGKGSTVAFLEAIARASGLRVGAYTSPHLVRYNERVRVEGVDAGDDALVEAFERIEAARGDVALTYFEFGTLAALLVLAQSGLDLAVLEVGLGGRLDAVNLVDADAAIVTTVDLDHTELLGSDRASIGYEKAGIFRPGRPAILGERDPPASLAGHARAIGARLVRAGVEYDFESGPENWVWSAGADVRLALPPPVLPGDFQLANAAAAIAALHALVGRLPFDAPAIARGVASARVRGRLERVRAAPEVVVDIGHNPQAARALAAWLVARPRGAGPRIAVFGALGDKDAAGLVAPLVDAFDAWHVVGLAAESPRGTDGASLAARVAPRLGSRIAGVHDAIEPALGRALLDAGTDGFVLAYGSFYTVTAVMRALAPDPASARL